MHHEPRGEGERVPNLLIATSPWRPARLRRARKRAASPTARRLRVAGAVVAVAAAALAQAQPSAADTLPLRITSPADGHVTNNPTPRFRGTTEYPFELGAFSPVMVKVYAGPTVSSASVEQLETPEFEGENWSVTGTVPLAPGEYTAQAEQREALSAHATESNTVTFTVDTVAPTPGLSSPVNGSVSSSPAQTVAGSASAQPGDLSAVTVQLYDGATIAAQAPLESLTVQSTPAGWSGTFGGLAPGTYTARGEQADEAGNIGYTAAASFTILAPAGGADAAPSATFQWLPASPRVGRAVTFVSGSTDPSSPITAYAWSLDASPFVTSKALLTATFKGAGLHKVALRVTAADGLTNTVVHTIRVLRAPLVLMQPFPIVRIAGSLTGSGVRVALLSAQVPRGARVQIACRGRGCPAGIETRMAGASGAKHAPATTLVAFPHFERALSAGVVVEIRISKSGRIGKYTRFAIKHGKLPERVDSCLGPAGIKPIACPGA